MAKNILLTGGSGLVGSHLKTALESHGCAVHAPVFRIENQSELRSEVKQSQWDAVIHLAAMSAFQECEDHPDKAFQINLAGTALLAREVLQQSPRAHFIFASTSQVYAPPSAAQSAQDVVIDETWPLQPRNAYAQSKLLAEQALKTYSELFGLKVSIFRIFNHTHKTQRPDFFLPHIYEEALKIKTGASKAIQVGNIDVQRDLGSVRDLVQAFRTLLDFSEELDRFEVFNVCSGVGRNLRQLSLLLTEKLGVEAAFAFDPARIRATDPKCIRGSYDKLHSKTGWVPQCHSDEDLIKDFLS